MLGHVLSASVGEADSVQTDSLAPPSPEAIPGVGDTLCGYQLEEVLGEGGLGTVFLARERALGDRPVVLKVTKRRGAEHLAMARLRHPHIMPIHAVHEDVDRDIRLICMPYLGGATLSTILGTLADRHPSDRTLEDLLRAIDRPSTVQGCESSWSGPRQFLKGATYHRAIAWIGSCLAEALHVAHVHGIVHLDVKPSNILLAEDGQPMLLDFHLAGPPVGPGTSSNGGIGGTLDYMGPEQAAGFHAQRQGSPLPSRVDGRADIYSLGAVMFEALGGSTPPGPDVKASYLLRSNPKLGSSLAASVTRCLALDPAERYQTGAELAAELRYYLGLPTLGRAAGDALSPGWIECLRRCWQSFANPV